MYQYNDVKQEEPCMLEMSRIYSNNRLIILLLYNKLVKNYQMHTYTYVHIPIYQIK